jgi:hypothetical protein
MADDIALVNGIMVIFRERFELPQTGNGTELQQHAGKLLVAIKAGESEMALRQLAGNAQNQLDHTVNDSTCRDVVERAQKLVLENS